MQEIWIAYLNHVPEQYMMLLYAGLSLLLTWPGFLLLEKLTPVNKHTPRANYWLNWKITFSSLLLGPLFSTVVVMLTVYIAGATGLPSLNIPTVDISVGIPLLDIFMQGAVIFIIACFMGDFSYYWWHRMQHKLPFLWELHKLHHSDEHLNTTTIYRSHFLEYGGQALFQGLTIGLIFNLTEPPQVMLAGVAGLLKVIWDYFIHANVKIDRLNHLLPFFSTPQYHWIHHSKLPQHHDKNFAIWLPVYDIIFGSYYRPHTNEYPPTGLASGEKFESVWRGQTAPFIAWMRMLKMSQSRSVKVNAED